MLLRQLVINTRYLTNMKLLDHIPHKFNWQIIIRFWIANTIRFFVSLDLFRISRFLVSELHEHNWAGLREVFSKLNCSINLTALTIDSMRLTIFSSEFTLSHFPKTALVFILRCTVYVAKSKSMCDISCTA